MEKTKLLKGALALVLMAMVAAPTQAFASTITNTGSGNTDVSYTNDGNIIDPDNPTDPKWTVSIPTAIVFTSSQKIVDADVELIATGGNTMPTGGSINVSVKSQNGYKLLVDGKDPMHYGIEYGGKTMSQTETTVGDLVAKNKISGKATLNPTAVAKVVGSHTDLLTYTVTTNGVDWTPLVP